MEDNKQIWVVLGAVVIVGLLAGVIGANISGNAIKAYNYPFATNKVYTTSETFNQTEINERLGAVYVQTKKDLGPLYSAPILLGASMSEGEMNAYTFCGRTYAVKLDYVGSDGATFKVSYADLNGNLISNEAATLLTPRANQLHKLKDGNSIKVLAVVYSMSGGVDKASFTAVCA
ncbi:MAG: hypothetical protein WC781_03010 [Candidatus Pacearchaeota archaeon]|jgi:hypothetical protein